MRRSICGVVLALGLLVAAGCSAPAPDQQELSDALVDSGLTRKVADCTASALTRSLTSAELAEITERGSGGAPVDDPKVTGDSADKLSKAMTTCRDLQIASQPTTTLDPATTSTTLTNGPATDGAEFNTTATSAP